MYWNFWGVTGDLIDKFIVYVTFTLLTVIGVGAHGAFDAGIRPYVAVAAFGATAIPLLCNATFSKQEELLTRDNIVNQQVFSTAFQLLATMPYLAAAFVRSKTAARVLFWIPPFSQIIAMVFTMYSYRYLHRNSTTYTRTAVSMRVVSSYRIA